MLRVEHPCIQIRQAPQSCIHVCVRYSWLVKTQMQWWMNNNREPTLAWSATVIWPWQNGKKADAAIQMCSFIATRKRPLRSFYAVWLEENKRSRTIHSKLKLKVLKSESFSNADQTSTLLSNCLIQNDIGHIHSWRQMSIYLLKWVSPKIERKLRCFTFLCRVSWLVSVCVNSKSNSTVSVGCTV